MSGLQAESVQVTSATTASITNGQQRSRSDHSLSLLNAETFSQLLASDRSSQPQPFDAAPTSYNSLPEPRSAERPPDSNERSSTEPLRSGETTERRRTEHEQGRDASSSEQVDNEAEGETEVDDQSLSQVSVALVEEVSVETILPVDDSEEQNKEGPRNPVVTGQEEETEEVLVDVDLESDKPAANVAKKNEANTGAQVADTEERDDSDRRPDRSDQVETRQALTRTDSPKDQQNKKTTAETQGVSSQSDTPKTASDGVKVGATQTEDIQLDASPTQTKRENSPKQSPELKVEVVSGSLSAPDSAGEKNVRTTQSSDSQPLQPTTSTQPIGATAQQRIQHNLLPRTTSADGGAGRVAVDSAKFLPRVAKAFSAAAERGGGEIRIRLSPPELGSIRLEVKMQGGNMTARMDAETPAARQALADNLPILRERLAEQGLRIEQLDIGTLDRQDRQAFDAHEQEQREQAANSRLEEERRANPDADSASPEHRIESTSLDVVA
jgi:flagellar hook-length control protein FliK